MKHAAKSRSASNRPLLTFVEAGKLAGLDPRTISKAVRREQIPIVTFNQKTFIPREAFMRFLSGEPAGARA